MNLNVQAPEFRPGSMSSFPHGWNPFAEEFTPHNNNHHQKKKEWEGEGGSKTRRPGVASTASLNPMAKEYTPNCFLGMTYSWLFRKRTPRMQVTHLPEDVINDCYCDDSSSESEEDRPTTSITKEECQSYENDKAHAFLDVRESNPSSPRSRSTSVSTDGTDEAPWYTTKNQSGMTLIGSNGSIESPLHASSHADEVSSLPCSPVLPPQALKDVVDDDVDFDEKGGTPCKNKKTKSPTNDEEYSNARDKATGVCRPCAQDYVFGDNVGSESVFSAPSASGSSSKVDKIVVRSCHASNHSKEFFSNNATIPRDGGVKLASLRADGSCGGTVRGKLAAYEERNNGEGAGSAGPEAEVDKTLEVEKMTFHEAGKIVKEDVKKTIRDENAHNSEEEEEKEKRKQEDGGVHHDKEEEADEANDEVFIHEEAPKREADGLSEIHRSEFDSCPSEVSLLDLEMEDPISADEDVCTADSAFEEGAATVVATTSMSSRSSSEAPINKDEQPCLSAQDKPHTTTKNKNTEPMVRDLESLKTHITRGGESAPTAPRAAAAGTRTSRQESHPVIGRSTSKRGHDSHLVLGRLANLTMEPTYLGPQRFAKAPVSSRCKLSWDMVPESESADVPSEQGGIKHTREEMLAYAKCLSESPVNLKMLKTMERPPVPTEKPLEKPHSSTSQIIEEHSWQSNNRRSTLSWREGAAKTQISVGVTKQKKREKKEKERGTQKLVTSTNSWGMKMRQKTNDEDVLIMRRMKSILNKLTLEKFDSLYEQLIECGMSKALHVEMLMKEVFEKATTQHNFIDMYTKLCVILNEWFQKNKVGDKECSFKRILLNQCQASFEADLQPPADLFNASVQDEEAFEMLVKFKAKMLGNIKFVGRLLVNRMVASRILIACCDVLLENYTSETIESLACLLTTTGPNFDDPSWAHHKKFRLIFDRIEELNKSKTTSPRIRFLLQDLLDLRASGWVSKDTSASVPAKLPAHRTTEAPSFYRTTPSPDKGNSTMRGSATVKQLYRAAMNAGQGDTIDHSSHPRPDVRQNSPRKPTPETSKTQKNSHMDTVKGATLLAPHDLPGYRRECATALRGFATKQLALEDAFALLKDLPQEYRTSEWLNLTSRIMDERSENTRSLGFKLLALLTDVWEGEGFIFTHALEQFALDFDDLVVDIPRLPEIVAKEMLAPHFKKKLPHKHPFVALLASME